MTKSSNLYVGMDVHKETIDIALAEGDGRQEVRHYGSIGGDLVVLDQAVRKLQATGKTLHFVYEAGPCGYVIYRHLAGKGLDCVVVAPSMIPKRSGDRVKTDRRDAEMLARLHRAGELSAVYVPHPEDEAVRDLTRAREDAKEAQTRARHQLKAFLLRSGIRYAGKTAWTPAHVRWIARIKLEQPVQQIVFQEYVNAVTAASERVERVEGNLRDAVLEWRRKPVVEALQALRGVQLVVAATLAAEIGQIERFDNPRQLMAYLGLVPSEYSSGASTRRGSITKCGNTHARRVLTEAAWAYRQPARITPIIAKRQDKLAKNIRNIAWKAQVRLCKRYRTLRARGKEHNKVVTAIARELSGFVWAIAREVSAVAPQHGLSTGATLRA
jgi:transposase